VHVSPWRGLLVLTLAALIAGPTVFAQAPAQAPAGKQWQPGEYDIYVPITKETQPAKRLELLDGWKQKFPKSDYDDVRQQAYLQSYSQILTGAYTTHDADQLALAQKVAADVLANLDALFANKP
jgi:hypothetical protein